MADTQVTDAAEEQIASLTNSTLRRLEVLEGESDRFEADDAANSVRWVGHLEAHEAHDKVHLLEHVHEADAARHEERRLAELIVAHDRIHDADRKAIDLALAAVDKLALIHAEAHAREHLNHEQRHKDAQEAILKSEISLDKRLETMNEVRAQLREQHSTFATSERVETLQSTFDQRIADTTKHTDERYEENRRRIEALEKGDVKAEGRSLGQGAVVAIIVGAVGLVGTILGILIVIANYATGAP